MIKSELYINTESIDISDQLFTGEIYFSVGENFFPEENWSDFLNVILNWWSVELIDLLENKTNSAELNFMDGPYKIVIDTNCEKNIWEFKFVENRQKNQVYSMKALPYPFLESIKTELNKLLRFYELQTVKSKEIDKLKSNFVKLHKLIRLIDQ